MMLGWISGFLFAVAASGLVSADPLSVIKIKSAKASTRPNDYFGDINIEWVDTKKNSEITIKLPTKKELPDTMLFKITASIDGQEPMEYVAVICENMDEVTIGRSMVEAGLPKGEFPKECPFVAGDFVISKWNPPSDAVPPGITGPIRGQVFLMEEGIEPYVTVDYEVQVSTALPGPPGFGR